MNKNISDILIVGSGPAGLTAAMYASRAGMNIVLLEKGVAGGQLWMSESIDNYPGFPEGISSYKLAELFEEHAKYYGAEVIRDSALSIESENDIFKVSTHTGRQVRCYSVIISSGASMSTLGIPGETEFLGKGVSYCAVCDGPLYRDKTVAVVGGGNTACEEAEYLTRFVEKLYLIHRRPKLRAVNYLKEKVENNPKIELIMANEIKEINGDGKVEFIGLKDGSELKADGVFIFIGLNPNTDFVSGLIDTEKGFIKTDDKLRTSCDGIYAAGDCRYNSFRQVITACADGALAAEESRKYVENKKGIQYDW